MSESTDWAEAALARLRQLGPPSSGIKGDENYNVAPPLRFREPCLPPPPTTGGDAAYAQWRHHCWVLRNLMGSGN